ncbi:magnesium-translocating P-type ATPase [Immundisolibacter sp.]
MTDAKLDAYWSLPAQLLLDALGSRPEGLTGAQAAKRLAEHGPNRLPDGQALEPLTLLLKQFTDPLVLILLFAALLSAFLREWLDASIVLVIVLGSGGLGFFQEYHASVAVAALRQRVASKVTVLRDGAPVSLPSEAVVPGDVVLLSAGSLVPADGIVLETKDFFVSESVLTGETFPVEKSPGVAPAKAGLAQRHNCVFMGTSVRSGTAHALLVQTGATTAFGAIAHRLRRRAPPAEFELGIRRFGVLLTQMMGALTLLVFAINVYFQRPVIEALLFSVALAVGLSPELLPAIMTITLSHGARAMAKGGVIVRRLAAIENLGSMDVLCADKTGTLTVGVIRLDGALGSNGEPSPWVAQIAYLNAHFETGIDNPLDEAIVGSGAPPGLDIAAWHKLDEVPYDFLRRRLSIVAAGPDGVPQLLTKGAFANVLAVCDRLRADEAQLPLDAGKSAQLQQRFAAWSAQGHRVLGVASRTLPVQASYHAADEAGLCFEGFLLFFDPPKPDIERTLADLRRLGVTVKIITGDNHLVATHVAQQVGMAAPVVITGDQLDEMRDEALWQRATATDLFAEVDPNQKERIILALKRNGHVVGYLGDGINDAPALHAADAGISVETAVDVAKQAADFVLLRHDLDVLRVGIEYGRSTFANTLKYIYTTTSANFGNMVSMALASLFLPFLPLLPKQILLNNFLSDLPAIGIATDRVDPEAGARPHRWNVAAIRRFMLTFGLISSLFDGLTFVTLLWLTDGAPAHFRTGWFVESLLTQLWVLLLMRTARPAWRSRPGQLLWRLTLLLTAVTLALPYLPLSHALFAFTPLPLTVLAAVLGITALYLIATELAKRRLFRGLA